MRFLFRLRAEQKGNVAPIFALMAVPVMFLAGSGYDYSRASKLRTKLQAAVDGTALTLCQLPSTTSNGAIESKARQLIAAYMPEGATLVTPVQVTTNPRQIAVTATATSPTAFAGLVGVDKLDVSATARCAPPYPKVFEIALVLDTTGSMVRSDGTTTKLASAKKAAKDFIDYVATSDAFDKATRISVVPFSSAVAVDPNAYGASTSWIDGQAKSDYHWTNIDVPNADSTTKSTFTNRFDIFNHLKGYVSSWKWAGCFESLPYPFSTKVEAPSSDKNSYFVPMFAPDEPGVGDEETVSIINNRDYSPRSSYKDLSPSVQSYYNSYTNDETSNSSCQKQTMTAQTAERRACKYRNPVGYKPTSSNSLGIPNGPNFLCNSKPLKRLTTNFSDLKNYIDTFIPEGNTNIFEGFMWGWRTVSPKSVFADGSPETKTDIARVIVLMTDGTNTWTSLGGTNFNRSLYSNFGYFVNADGTTAVGRFPTGTANPNDGATARAAMDALTQEGCSNAKTARYSVYTVGFSVPSDPIDSEGLALLKGCATAESQFFVAKSGSELVDAFKTIALQIGKLRLTQ